MFPHRKANLWHQRGVQQLGFILTGTTWWRPAGEGLRPADGSHIRRQAHGPAATLYFPRPSSKFRGSHHSPLSFDNPLDKVTEPRKHLTYIYQFLIKDTTQEPPNVMEETYRARWGLCRASTPHPGHTPAPSPLMCSPTWNLSKPHHLGFLMKVVLHRHD